MEALADGFTMPLVGKIGEANVSGQLSPDNVLLGRRRFGGKVFLRRGGANDAVCVGWGRRGGGQLRVRRRRGSARGLRGRAWGRHGQRCYGCYLCSMQTVMMMEWCGRGNGEGRDVVAEADFFSWSRTTTRKKGGDKTGNWGKFQNRAANAPSTMIFWMRRRDQRMVARLNKRNNWTNTVK